MQKFICKAQSGVPIPTDLNKQKLLAKMLKFYEMQNITFTVTLDLPRKDINEQQLKLYKAFIVQAADHFGNTYSEMEKILKDKFYPIDPTGSDIPLHRWSSEQLDLFITKSTALLVEHGFQF